MSTFRAYTWGIVTYARNESEFQPLLSKANHWAFAYHDKDTVVQDDGTRKPKEPHFHVIVTFETEQSWKQVRNMVESDQTTLAQDVKTKDKDGKAIVRGLWRYLTHEGEDPNEKYIYDPSIRTCDDIDYWTKRTKTELDMIASEDSFFEDLTATESFSIRAMGRKYGRDFMKNINSYLAFRAHVLQEDEREHGRELREQAWKRNREKLDELCDYMTASGIDVEEVPKRLWAQTQVYHTNDGYEPKGK